MNNTIFIAVFAVSRGQCGDVEIKNEIIEYEDCDHKCCWERAARTLIFSLDLLRLVRNSYQHQHAADSGGKAIKGGGEGAAAAEVVVVVRRRGKKEVRVCR